MNTHVPDVIKNKYPNFTFKGKAFIRKNRKMIRAYNSACSRMFYYSFSEDFFWLSYKDLPDNWLLK